MWQKFREDGGKKKKISMPEIFSPMLTVTSLEATISECSLEIKPSRLISPKAKERLVISISILFIICVPLTFFFTLVYERKHDFSASSRKFHSNGTFHSAVTTCGPVIGMAKNGGYEFLGIPYAISPSSKITNKDGIIKNFKWEPGTRQFRLEQCWEGELNYSSTTPSECLQWKLSTDSKPEVFGSEDCLTLDIYTPSVGYDTPSPVVVVIAIPSLVGGWTDDTHKEQVTPSAELAAEKGVVFVVPRFRLGPIGFLPRLLLNDTSDVIKNSTDFTDAVYQAKKTRLQLEKSYNLGLTDLTAALMWVQMNIEHFSGDPSIVTLLGWGAGADLVTSLTATRPPKGQSFLFTQAWITGAKKSSSSVGSSKQFDRGYELWANSQCNKSHYDPLCLLTLPAENLMEAVPPSWLADDHLWLQPDRFWFQQPARDVWSRPDFPQDFPFVVGTTAHAAAELSEDCETVESAAKSATESLLNSIPEQAVKRIISNFYRNVSDFHSKIAVLSDSRSVCPSLELAKQADRSFISGVFFYISTFEEPISCSNISSFHLARSFTDISAILGRYSGPKSDSSAAYVSQMQDVFYHFITDGSLPGSVRVHQGLYEIKQTIDMRFGYPPCAIWQ